EVKRRSADGSVGSPHARVGHCQASNKAETPCQKRGVFAMWKRKREKPSAAQRAFFISESWSRFNEI
ncbi:hypothetical protein, partial [Yersinia rochesterensis]|uniref:hypothetical protein n=1 Tax=Yersinia rochesterensis TaxID=1604335 RepID=UPI001C94CC6A